MHLSEIIKNLAGSYFKLATDVATLAGLEARLAIHSLIYIIALSLILIALFTCTWLCLSVILFFGLILLHINELLALFIVLFFNLVSMAIIWMMLLKIKSNVSFPVTRKQLHTLNSLKEANHEHETNRIEN